MTDQATMPSIPAGFSSTVELAAKEQREGDGARQAWVCRIGPARLILQAQRQCTQLLLPLRSVTGATPA